MTLFFNYDGSGPDLGNQRVRLGQIAGLSEMADGGQIGGCDLPIDDPLADLVLEGHRAVNVNETACTPARVWSGYATLRDTSRGAGDSLITGAARRWVPSLIDLNSLAAFRILHGKSAKRPAETDVARIAWLMGSGSFTPQDLGHVTPSIVHMSATDYSGQFPVDVLNDCAEVSGNNWFIYFDEATGFNGLFYESLNYAGYDATISISNVLADQSSTCFAPLIDAKLSKDPSRVFTGVYMPYSGGSVFVEQTGPILRRDTAAPSANTTSRTVARAKAQKFLDQAATEQDVITCTIKVPRDKVNHVLPGQRIVVRFSHLPGYTSNTLIHVRQRTVMQNEDSDQFYNILLELTEAKQMGATGSSPDNSRTWPPSTAPFQQECDEPFVQGMTSLNADGDIMTFDHDLTVGNLLVWASVAGPSTQPDITGVTALTPVIVIANTIHLGGPENARVYQKVIEASDLINPSTGLSQPTSFYKIFGITGAGGDKVCMELTNVDPTSAAVTEATGASGTAAVSASAGDMGVGFVWGLASNLETSTASGYTNTGNVAHGSDFPWGGYTNDAPTAISMGIVPGSEWLASIVTYTLSGDNCTEPAAGQPLPCELLGYTDGFTALFRTNRPYAPDSNHVRIGGVSVAITETDATTGQITIPAIWAATTGAAIIDCYQLTTDPAVDPSETGAGNIVPDPELGIVTPADAIPVRGFEPFVGESLAYMRADSTEGGAVPYQLLDGETFYIPPRHQSLFGMTIDCEGIIECDGYLVEIS